MIAGGVGIAPFRAFLLERIAALESGVPAFGPSLLLYGVRSQSDVIYTALMQEAVSKGALGSFDVAIGDPTRQTGGLLAGGSNQSGARFICDLVQEHADAVWSAIQVCCSYIQRVLVNLVSIQ